MKKHTAMVIARNHKDFLDWVYHDKEKRKDATSLMNESVYETTEGIFIYVRDTWSIRGKNFNGVIELENCWQRRDYNEIRDEINVRMRTKR